MANLSKAVCHGESDKCRFGNPPQESNFQRLGIMEILSTSANIASILCLPATVAALPGIIFMISTKMRKWFDSHQTVTTIYVVLIVISAISIVVTRLGLLDKATPVFIPVHERTFDNEVVLLDGRSYYKCVFNNVTFLWNGEPYVITQSQVTGTSTFESKNDLIINTIKVLSDLNALNPTGLKIIPKEVIEEHLRRGQSKP